MQDIGLAAILDQHAQKLTCEHCGQVYGDIPQGVGIPDTLILIENKQGYLYYKDGLHCVPCGDCDRPVQKETMRKPACDPAICQDCYDDHGSSSYAFEDEI